MLKPILVGIIGISLWTNTANSSPLQEPITQWDETPFYEILEGPLPAKLEDLNTRIEADLAKYSYSLIRMTEEELSTFIGIQKEYVELLQTLTTALGSIYFLKSTDAAHTLSVDDEVNALTRAIVKKCGLIKKFTQNCLDKKERLLFQAEYLNEKILDLEIQQSTLLNGIQFELEQQEIDSPTLRI